MPNKSLRLSLEKLIQTSRYFFVIFLLLFLITAVVTILIYSYEVKNERVAIETFESSHTASAKAHVVEEFTEAISDLKILATHQEVREFLEKADLENLSQEALQFSEIKGLYDQLRFLDETGMEIIRIDYNNGTPKLVANEDLQNKEDRYYFKESIHLNRGEVYVSPLDLNVEQGEIEQPLKPMIRFATPIFDDNGNKRGIAVANYFGEHLLKALEGSAAHAYGHIMLVNKDSYWLKGMKPEDEWGFMYEDKQDLKFGTDYPEEWERVKDEESGQFYSEEGLFTFVTICPLEETIGGDYCWKMIGHVPQEVLQKNPRRLLFWMIIVDGFLFAVIVGGSWVLAQSVAKRREAEKKIVELNGILKLLNKILRHDILNDLSVASGNIDNYLEYGDKEVNLDEMLKDVKSSMRQGINFVDKMRELEKAVTSGKELKPVDVRKIISEVQNNFQKLQFSVEGEGVVLADEALGSVITNIVRNAEMHGKTEKIDISIKEKGNTIEIQIADYGKGIPDKIKDKLFAEEFKYGETGHTGLGLYIVRKTIERYGGKAWVEDNKPKGSVFVLQFQKA